MYIILFYLAPEAEEQESKENVVGEEGGRGGPHQGEVHRPDEMDEHVHHSKAQTSEAVAHGRGGQARLTRAVFQNFFTEDHTNVSI